MAREIINTIIDRCNSSKDLRGNQFQAYSKDYKNSDVFESMNKSSRVNLRLFGEMLNSIDFDTSPDSIEIFFDDEEQAAKAHGHNNGSKILPKREFFGLSDEEEQRIIQKYTKLAEKSKENPKLADLLNSITDNASINIQVPEQKQVEETYIDRLYNDFMRRR